MKKIIKLTESDLARIVKRVVNEAESPTAPEMPETPPEEYLDLVASVDVEKRPGEEDMTQQVAEEWHKKRMERKRRFNR